MYPAAIKWLAAVLLMAAALVAPRAHAATVVVPASGACTYSASSPLSSACQLLLQNAGCVPSAGISGVFNSSTTAITHYSNENEIPVPAQSCVTYDAITGAVQNIYQFAGSCPDDNSPIEGTVPRSGAQASIPPQQVCHQLCTYTLDHATNVIGPNDAPQWLGMWRRDGGTCTSSPAPGSEPTTTEPGTSDGPPGPVGEDGCKVDDYACQAQKVDAELNKLKALKNSAGEVDSIIGKPLAWVGFTWLFTASPTRECAFDITVPERNNLLRQWVGDKITVSVCEHTDKIDRIGGWLVYITTAMAAVGLFFAKPGAA